MSEIAVKVENLTKKYIGKHALDNVSLSIPTGSVYGLIGRNGAGKTTFMKLVLGMINVSEGNIEILGTNNLDKVRKEIGSIIETPTFYENMNAYQNLKYRAMLLGIEDLDEEVNRVLKEVGLYEQKHMRAKNYSLGMRQRLGIAAALIGNPKILMLDEPINGLDPVAIKDIRDILLNLKEKGVTIVISSHILGELEKISTNYAIIADGKLVKEITEEEIAKSNINLEEYFVKLLGGNE